MKKLVAFMALVRGSNWWYSKIPPLLAVAYAGIALLQLPAQQAWGLLLALMVSSCLLAAYGHVLNDMCDIEIDRKAGKPNGMTHLSRSQRMAMVVGLALAGLIPWLVVRIDLVGLILLGTIYALPIVYNVPPMRSKERGIWGILIDAGQAHVVPSLFVVTILAEHAEGISHAVAAFAALVTAWATFKGLRDILRHQLWDRANDLRTGVPTYATQVSPDGVRRLIRRVLFPGEVLTLIGMGVVVFSAAPWFVTSMLILTALFLSARLTGVWQVAFDPAASTRPAGRPGSHTQSADAYVPLVEFYTVWPALGLALHLGTVSPGFIPLAILQAALFHDALYKQAADLGAIMHLMRATARRAYWRLYGRLSRLYRKMRRTDAG